MVLGFGEWKMLSRVAILFILWKILRMITKSGELYNYSVVLGVGGMSHAMRFIYSYYATGIGPVKPGPIFSYKRCT